VEALRRGQHSGPVIYLQESHTLEVNHVGVTTASNSLNAGQARPLSLSSGDFDSDGVEDLLVGYQAPEGGIIVFHRGNLDAFAPQSQESFQAIAEGRFPSPFLKDAPVFNIPLNPDFMATGNFTGGGNLDLAVAARGGHSLYLFAGDGHGQFAAPKVMPLPGAVTVLAGGEMWYGQGLTRLVVGVENKDGAGLWVYGDAGQEMTPLASYRLKAAATAVAEKRASARNALAWQSATT